jgi:UDP-N-acetylmuramoyl-L-alanyl-D-glutamate--2,6-diaminopimelate ligase
VNEVLGRGFILLGDLIGQISCVEPPELAEPELSVTGIAYDSRRVRKGHVFVAVHGFKTDGTRFIPDAVARGAVAVIADRKPGTLKNRSVKTILPQVPVILVRDVRETLSLLSSIFYGHPSRKLLLIGITGTNGKTTTSYLIGDILKRQGYRTGVIGTIGYRIGNIVQKAPNTTPESTDLQALFAAMVKKGVTACVMEVSSHALALKRVEHCAFDAALFTNLTEDHFDFHGNFRNYYSSKKHLFELLKKSPKKEKLAVVNIDDSWGRKLLKDMPRGLHTATYGVRSDCDFKAGQIRLDVNRTGFSVEGLDVRTRLSGMFNVYNVLGSYALADGLRFKKILTLESIRKFRSVPGRFELLHSRGCPAIIVDYAHTDDALKNVLSTIQGINAQRTEKGRVITVFGCGGDRDRLKRPKMGAIASSMSDIVIVTSDNPRTEDPLRIIKDIMAGIRDKKKPHVSVQPDRKKAISMAFKLAGPADIILIAGKGHEDYQIFMNRTVHFSDRETAAKLLKEKCG